MRKTRFIAPGIERVVGYVSNESMWGNPGRDGKRQRLQYGGFKHDKGRTAAARRAAKPGFKPTTLKVTPRREDDFAAPVWGHR